MAIQSLIDITSVINQQIDTQELLSERLCKLEAILFATSAERLLEYENISTLQNYLWVLCDITMEIRGLHAQALSAMMKGRRKLVYGWT